MKRSASIFNLMVLRFILSEKISGEIYYELFEKTQEFINETEMEIYNHILEEEVIYLHELSKIVENNGGVVLDLSTDSVSCVFRGEFPFKTKDIESKTTITDYFFNNISHNF